MSRFLLLICLRTSEGQEILFFSYCSFTNQTVCPALWLLARKTHQHSPGTLELASFYPCLSHHEDSCFSFLTPCIQSRHSQCVWKKRYFLSGTNVTNPVHHSVKQKVAGLTLGFSANAANRAANVLHEGQTSSWRKKHTMKKIKGGK